MTRYVTIVKLYNKLELLNNKQRRVFGQKGNYLRRISAGNILRNKRKKLHLAIKKEMEEYQK